MVSLKKWRLVLVDNCYMKNYGANIWCLVCDITVLLLHTFECKHVHQRRFQDMCISSSLTISPQWIVRVAASKRVPPLWSLTSVLARFSSNTLTAFTSP